MSQTDSPKITGKTAGKAKTKADPKSAAPQSDQTGDATRDDALAVEAPAGLPPWLEEALPWVGSLMINLAFGLLIMFALWAAKKVTDKLQEPIVIPQSFNDSFSETPGGIPHPGTGGDPTRDAMQSMEKIQSEGLNQQNNPADTAKLLKGNNNDADAMLAAMGGNAGGKNTGGIGRGGGGALAAFGAPGGGGGIGPKSSLYGNGGNAKYIVYIIDHSGSISNNSDYLKNEVKRSIQGLLPVQEFNVIAFSDDCKVLGGTGLERANTANKTDVAEKIDKLVFTGENDDTLEPFVTPFRKAFAMSPPPQLIYFLTDGGFDPKLMDTITELNKAKKVHINTLAFVKIPKLNADLLQKMATENGGRYTFVTQQQLEDAQ